MILYLSLALNLGLAGWVAWNLRQRRQLRDGLLEMRADIQGLLDMLAVEMEAPTPKWTGPHRPVVH